MNQEIRILVIDDEEVVHASIRRILSRFGHRVAGALCAREGLERLQKEEYDVVITDLMMPEMNGLEMLQVMKERAITVPSLMITGYPTIKTAIQALRLGALDYLPKPFTRQELIGPLQRALRRAGKPWSEDSKAVGSAGRNDEAAAPDPGDTFVLPGHSWARYNQDGTADIGIESEFLSSIPVLDEIRLPLPGEMVDQGHPGIELKAGGEVHTVFMPLSGRVMTVDEDQENNLSGLTGETPLVRILPTQLLQEITLLRKGRRRPEPENRPPLPADDR